MLSWWTRQGDYQCILHTDHLGSCCVWDTVTHPSHCSHTPWVALTHKHTQISAKFVAFSSHCCVFFCRPSLQPPPERVRFRFQSLSFCRAGVSSARLPHLFLYSSELLLLSAAALRSRAFSLEKRHKNHKGMLQCFFCKTVAFAGQKRGARRPRCSLINTSRLGSARVQLGPLTTGFSSAGILGTEGPRGLFLPGWSGALYEEESIPHSLALNCVRSLSVSERERESCFNLFSGIKIKSLHICRRIKQAVPETIKWPLFFFPSYRAINSEWLRPTEGFPFVWIWD